LFVKTNDTLIGKEEAKGVPRKKIFPPGLTTEYTYEEILQILRGANWQQTQPI